MRERISFPQTKKFFATGHNKDSLKIYFHEMEKLLPVEGLFEKLEENGVHWPEN